MKSPEPSEATDVLTGSQLARFNLPGLADWRERLAIGALLRLIGDSLRLVDAERLTRLPDSCLFALNHNTSLETVLAPAALVAGRGGCKIRFVVDWVWMHVPVAGWLIRHTGAIPVYNKPARWRVFDAYRLRQRRPRAALAAALAALQRGESVGVFPEGTRNRDAGRLLAGRGGLGWLALRTTVPLIPVGIARPGTHHHDRIPEWSPIELRVGQPLSLEIERAHFRGLSRLPPDRRRRAEQELQNVVVDRAMAALGRLADKRAPTKGTAQTGRSRVLATATLT